MDQTPEPRKRPSSWEGRLATIIAVLVALGSLITAGVQQVSRLSAQQERVNAALDTAARERDQMRAEIIKALNELELERSRVEDRLAAEIDRVRERSEQRQSQVESFLRLDYASQLQSCRDLQGQALVGTVQK